MVGLRWADEIIISWARDPRPRGKCEGGFRNRVVAQESLGNAPLHRQEKLGADSAKRKMVYDEKNRHSNKRLRKINRRAEQSCHRCGISVLSPSLAGSSLFLQAGTNSGSRWPIMTF